MGGQVIDDGRLVGNSLGAHLLINGTWGRASITQPPLDHLTSLPTFAHQQLPDRSLFSPFIRIAVSGFLASLTWQSRNGLRLQGDL